MYTEIIILDTNIVIDYLQGRHQADRLFDVYAEKKYRIMISIITVIEVLVGIFNLQDQKKVRDWLMAFSPIKVCSKIADLAVGLRQEFKLKVPDAVIASTAQLYQGTLVTRDRDFKHIPGVQYPYDI